MGKLIDRVKFVAVAGVGLFGDGFLNISIGLVVPIIGYIYYANEGGKVPTVPSDVIKGGLSLGMIVGQLGFGLFGDALGRHKIYGKELILTILGTLLLIVAPPHLDHGGIVGWLTAFRVLTGLGIGGARRSGRNADSLVDYPMTSSISAEATHIGSRAKLVLTVFSCIGLGAFTSGIVYLILLAAFKQAILGNIHRLQWVWRLLFGIGLVPLMLTLYARLTMKESVPYEKYVAHETGLVGKDKRGLGEQLRDFREYFSNWKHARTLFAVSACWFLFDVAFYGINLNQSIVLEEIGYGKGATPFENLWNIAVGNIIVNSAGYLPGFYIGIFLPDLMGRRLQQFVFSAASAVLYAVWAGLTNTISTGGLMAIFTISQLVLNAGPNVTTFLLPVEAFPTRVRGTAHGIAAAAGKAGAVFTAFAFGTITDRIGIDGVLGLFSGIMALTAVITLLIPETKGRSIEEIEKGVLYGESITSDLESDETHFTERGGKQPVQQVKSAAEVA